MPITPAISAPGSNRIDASVRIFTISLVRCSVRRIKTSNELTTASLASRAEASATSTCCGELLEPLGRPLGRDEIELGMGQRDEDFAMRREGSTQPADARANLDQFGDLCLGVAAGAVEDRDVELLERRFDLVERPRVARHDPCEERREKRCRVEDAELAPSFGERAEVVDHRQLALVGRDDEVLADRSSRSGRSRVPGRSRRSRRRPT